MLYGVAVAADAGQGTGLGAFAALRAAQRDAGAPIGHLVNGSKGKRREMSQCSARRRQDNAWVRQNYLPRVGPAVAELDRAGLHFVQRSARLVVNRITSDRTLATA